MSTTCARCPNPPRREGMRLCSACFAQSIEQGRGRARHHAAQQVGRAWADDISAAEIEARYQAALVEIRRRRARACGV